jgi:hypothetical protein
MAVALFDQVLPRAALTGGRNVVLFQRSDGDERSLALVKRVLTQYLRAHGSDTEVAVIAMADYIPPSGIPYVTNVTTNESTDNARQIDTPKYHAVAPHPAYHPGDPSPDHPVLGADGRLLPRSENFAKLQRGLAERMKHDRTLEAAVDELFGAKE